MSLAGQFWKPEKSDKPKVAHKKKRLKIKAKVKRSSSRKSKRNEARKFCLTFLGLHKYASTISIAYVISQKYNREMPGTENGAKNLIMSFCKEFGKVKAAKKEKNTLTSDEFYSSKKWKELRYIALSNSEGSCNLCMASSKDGVQLHVDHIVPRSVNPSLQYSLDNLQVLCQYCNIGKSNYDCKDWRQLTIEPINAGCIISRVSMRLLCKLNTVSHKRPYHFAIGRWEP